MEPKEGPGDWSLFLQTRNGEHEGAFVPGRALQGPAWFQSPIPLILFTLEKNRCRTRKGIVLDRGGAIVGLTMDLLYPSEKDTVIIGRQYDINFKIVRWGY